MPIVKAVVMYYFFSSLVEGMEQMQPFDQATTAESLSLRDTMNVNNQFFSVSQRLLALSVCRYLLYYLKNYRRWKIIDNYIAKLKQLAASLHPDFKRISIGSIVIKFIDDIIRDAYVLDFGVPPHNQLLRNKYVRLIEEEMEKF